MSGSASRFAAGYQWFVSRLSVLLLTLAALSAAAVWVWLADRSPAPVAEEPQRERPSLAMEWRELPDDVKPEMADTLHSKTGITILFAVASFTAPGGKVSGRAPSREEAKAAALTVVNELQRYPDAYLRAAGVENVVLVRNIRTLDGHELGGLASPPNHSLLMTTESSSAFWRSVLHHELFHLFDRNDFDAAGWAALNPYGFRYDPSEALVRDPGVSFGIDPTHYGFVTRYSTFNEREDRAELISWLVLDQAAVMRVTGHDNHLAAKVQRLKQDVAGRVPEMGDRFWANQ